MQVIAESEIQSTNIQIQQETSAPTSLTCLKCVLIKYKCFVILMLTLLNLAQSFVQYHQQFQVQHLQEVINQFTHILESVYFSAKNSTNVKDQ